HGASPAGVGRQDNATLSALDSIDAAVLGFTRSVDHQFWMGLPDVTLLLTPTGYAYISSFGGIGPCAVRSPRDFPGLLAMSIQRAAELKLQHVSFVVPGLASAALACLLGHDGRYAADMTVLLSSRPFGRLNRYLLPASDALF
ncbi:MAG TPA: hypothetical protein VF937_10935, partial [Chloroflexota bacterium]